MEFEQKIVYHIGYYSFVSAFNILIAMWMMVKSKLKDIAMFLSMGANEKDIRWTFLLQGLIMEQWALFWVDAWVLYFVMGNNIMDDTLTNRPFQLCRLFYDIVSISIILWIVVSGICRNISFLLATQTNISDN
jgi:hypothetical protein